MLFANCHFHSAFSDGVYTPEQLAELAVQVGYKALVLTDHDTIRGCYFLQKAAYKAGIMTLLGCEFTTKWHGRGVHLLGLDFNPENKDVRRLIRHGVTRQTKRTEFLFHYALEQGTLRKGATWEEILEAHPDNDFFGNNQVFNVLVKKGVYQPMEYQEFVKNFPYRGDIDREIERLTGYGDLELEEVAEGIRRAGGVPIIAHPYGMKEHAGELLKAGAMGFETRHPQMNEEETAFFSRFCEEHGLYKSGGSDHYSLLGGYEKSIPSHDIPPECGYVEEADFMALYRREKG